jgi:hypothetical protein
MSAVGGLTVDDGSCVYHHQAAHAGVNFEAIQPAAPVATPYGQLLVAACGPVKRGDGTTGCNGASGRNPNSSACLLTNFTGDRREIGCGMAPGGQWRPSPRYIHGLPDPELAIGMVQRGGDSCGGLVPSSVTFSTTIAFVCDSGAVEGGQLVFNGMSPSPDAPPGVTAACNFNLTWRTSAVCTLPLARDRPRLVTPPVAKLESLLSPLIVPLSNWFARSGASRLLQAKLVASGAAGVGQFGGFDGVEIRAEDDDDDGGGSAAGPAPTPAPPRPPDPPGRCEGCCGRCPAAPEPAPSALCKSTSALVPIFALVLGVGLGVGFLFLWRVYNRWRQKNRRAQVESIRNRYTGRLLSGSE